MRLGLMLVLLLLAAPLRAEPACDRIEALRRLGMAAVAGDVAALGAARRGLDLGPVMRDLRGHPLAAHREEIAAALALADRAAARAVAAGPAGAAAWLGTPPLREAAGRFAALMARQRCAASAGRAAAGGMAGEAPPGIGMRGVQWAAPAIGTVAAGLGGLGFALLAAQIVARRRSQRHRQARRHPVSLPARIRSGTAETEVRLIDISRLGAKIRVDPGFEPAGLKGVTLLLGGQRIGATARWRNRHYLGVEFLRPLPEEAVAPLLETASPEARGRRRRRPAPG